MQLSPRAAALLDALVEHGIFGLNRGQAARRIVERWLFENIIALKKVNL